MSVGGWRGNNVDSCLSRSNWRGRHTAGLSVLAIAILTAVIPAFAQSTGTATLVGTVTDSSGLVIPGAKVTVVNTETAFRSETVTSSEGGYYVPYLSPGTYQITIEASGFKRLGPPQQ